MAKDEEETWLQKLSVYLLFAAIVAFMVIPIKVELARVCDDENGYELVSAACSHFQLQDKLFNTSRCYVSYRKESFGVYVRSFSSPATYSDGIFEFTGTDFMVGDSMGNNGHPPIRVKVDFENYIIETDGAVRGRFDNCRSGES